MADARSHVESLAKIVIQHSKGYALHLKEWMRPFISELQASPDSAQYCDDTIVTAVSLR